MSDHETDSTAMETVRREEFLRFFSVLSHDLKSPIFSIDGFSELLAADYSDRLDEEGRDFLQRIRSAAQQMKRVLDDMGHIVKLVSRPDARRMVELSEVVDQLRLRFNFLLEEGGVTFDVPSDLPAVYADPEKLREALSALLSNALTFTDQQPGSRHVSFQTSKSSESMDLCMVDDGIGIDPRYQTQIFDLGIKLDKARGEGPGYGLFLARRIAESHGGSLTVSSTGEGGSRFCISLPLSADAARAS